jgi:predicted ATPase
MSSEVKGPLPYASPSTLTRPLLQRVVGKSEDELDRMLRHLQLAEFIYEQPAAGDIEYTFKHTLTQEVAYKSVLVERRKLLHERIGSAVEATFGQSIDDHLGQLAHHYGRSANVRKAILYQRLSGVQAARRFAHHQAAAHLRGALDLIKSLPDSPERSRQKLDLLVTLGSVLMAISGMGAPEARRVYQRARELCGVLDDDSQLFAVLWGLFATFTMNMELKEGQKIADELTSVAEQSNDDAQKLEAHHAQWNTRWLRGELGAALLDTERGITLYNRPAHAALAARFGDTTRVPALASAAEFCCGCWATQIEASR